MSVEARINNKLKTLRLSVEDADVRISELQEIRAKSVSQIELLEELRNGEDEGSAEKGAAPRSDEPARPFTLMAAIREFVSAHVGVSFTKRALDADVRKSHPKLSFTFHSIEKPMAILKREGIVRVVFAGKGREPALYEGVSK